MRRDRDRDTRVLHHVEEHLPFIVVVSLAITRTRVLTNAAGDRKPGVSLELTPPWNKRPKYNPLPLEQRLPNATLPRAKCVRCYLQTRLVISHNNESLKRFLRDCAR